jgi:hypothetical protein
MQLRVTSSQPPSSSFPGFRQQVIEIRFNNVNRQSPKSPLKFSSLFPSSAFKKVHSLIGFQSSFYTPRSLSALSCRVSSSISYESTRIFSKVCSLSSSKKALLHVFVFCLMKNGGGGEGGYLIREFGERLH